MPATASRNGQRMPEREEQPGRDRLLALLHQLAHDIVDGGDVIGVHGVSQPEHISEERRCPASVGRSASAITAQAQTDAVDGKEQEIDRGNLSALIGRRVVDRLFQEMNTSGPRVTFCRRERGPKDVAIKTWPKGLTKRFGQKTWRPSDHPSIHPDRCLSRRLGRRQVSWLADRRLARLPGKQSGFQWLIWTRLPAHSCGDSCGFGTNRPHRIPFSPSCEEPSVL